MQGLIGFGSWMRKFYMNDPWMQGPRPPPKYDASAATLRVDFRLYPVAFFTEGWASGFLIHLQYQQAVGLSSQSPQTVNGSKTTMAFGTTMRELLLGFGYDWKIFGDKELSPHLELTLGFGMMDFGIDWGTDTTIQHTLPDASYRFFIGSLAFRYDFLSWLGAKLAFDFRAMSGVGQIEDETSWYGSTSTNGIGLQVIAYSNIWKGITLTAEYNLTYYFYAFANAQQQQDAGRSAAGGAVDLMHTLMVCAGYQF